MFLSFLSFFFFPFSSSSPMSASVGQVGTEGYALCALIPFFLFALYTYSFLLISSLGAGAPSNCSVSNQTWDTLEVMCLPPKIGFSRFVSHSGINIGNKSQ